MKEIFETYKTPELRFLAREHNKKVRAVVRNEVKEIRQRILKKRLIDLKFKKRPEIISKLLENKRFFKTLKKRPDNFTTKKPTVKEAEVKKEVKKEVVQEAKKIKKEEKKPEKPKNGKAKEIKKIVDEASKESTEEDATLKIDELTGDSDLFFTDEEFKIMEKEASRRIKERNKGKEESAKEEAERLKEFKERLKLKKKKKKGEVTIEKKKTGKDNPTVKKLLGGEKARKEELKRIGEKAKRQEQTAIKLFEEAKAQNLTEKERQGVNKIKSSIDDGTVTAKELEKLKRIIKKYTGAVPEQPRQNKLKNLQNTIARLRKAIREIKEPKLKKANEAKLKILLEEKEKLRAEKKEEKKKAKEPKAEKKEKPKEKPKKEKPKKKEEEEGLKLTIEPVKEKKEKKEKKADFKKNPDVNKRFQIDNKTQELVLKAYPKAEGFDKDDQEDLFDNLIEKYAEIIAGETTFKEVEEDSDPALEKEYRKQLKTNPAASKGRPIFDENEFKLFEYMVKNKLFTDKDNIIKTAEEKVKLQKKIDREFKEEQKRLEKEAKAEEERVKKLLSGSVN